MAVSGSSMTPKTTANDLTMSVGANDGTAIATTLHGDMERIAAGTQQQQQHDTHQQHQQLEGKSSPRPYQLELLEHARARNIIAYLDTGAGKTLVSILLMLDHAPRVVEPISPEVVVAFRRRHADNEVLRDLHARRARLERELGDVLLSASAASSAEASAGNANTGLPKSMTNGSTAASLEVEIRQVADSIHRLEATWRVGQRVLL